MCWLLYSWNKWLRMPSLNFLGKGNIFMCYVGTLWGFHDKFVYKPKLLICLFPRAFDVSRHLHSCSWGQDCAELNSLHIVPGIYRQITALWLEMVYLFIHYVIICWLPFLCLPLSLLRLSEMRQNVFYSRKEKSHKAIYQKYHNWTAKRTAKGEYDFSPNTINLL